jgi:putative ABC transport system ATP-binding protein
MHTGKTALPSSLISMRDIRLAIKSDAGVTPILNGIDLDIANGETVAITGASGSGKSSLLMVMATLEAATSGQLTIAGRALTHLSEDELAHFRRDHIGIVFQAFHLIPTMTALENVLVPLELAGKPDALSRARETLRDVGLDHRLHHLPAQMSGGEQQRVALARAFAGRPKLLLADEPTGNLDATNGAAIMDLMAALHERSGATLVLVTHDLALAARCQRQIHIVDGRIA